MPRGDKPTTAALALKDGWIYEDALPADISKAQYDWWFKESLVLDGVRMGPPLPPDRAWIKLLSNGELAAYRTDIRGEHFDGRPVYEFTRVSADSTAPVVNCDYRNQTCAAYGVTIGGKWICNNHICEQRQRCWLAAAAPAAQQEDAEVLPSPRIVHRFGPCGYKYCDWPDGELRCNEPRSFPAAPTPSLPVRDAETLVKQWIATLQDESHVTDEDAEDLVLKIIAFKSAPAAAETVGERELLSRLVNQLDRAIGQGYQPNLLDIAEAHRFLSTDKGE